MLSVQSTGQIKHNPGVTSYTSGLSPPPLQDILQSALINSFNPPIQASISYQSVFLPVCNPINPTNQIYSCVDEPLLAYPLIMWNVEPSANHQSDRHTTLTSHNQPCSLSKSMLPDISIINPETSPIALPQSKTNSRSAPPPLSHPLSIHHPTVIRSLKRPFSPPFKPFGSKESETNEEDSIVTLDSPITFQSMHSTDLSSTRFQNPSNAEVIVLSASQTPKLKMKASGSKPKRSESTFTPINGDSFDSPGDSELQTFALDSDVKMQDPPSLKRPRRQGDKSNRQKNNLNPFSTSQSSISDLSIPPNNTSRAVTFAQSSKPSRSNTRSNQLSGSTSSLQLTKQPSDDDEDTEETVAPKSKLLANGNGRAATARRALLNNGSSGLVWSGGEQPTEPVPSSSTAIIPSPRLRSTRRLSPNGELGSPTRPDGSSSSEHEDDKTSQHPHESPPGIEPAKKSKIKSASNVARSTKRPKPPSPSDPSTAPNTPATPAPDGACKGEVKRRIAALLPATEPDESGQYESSTCHQCRVKTTRPKMICDQSQDLNCVVRVCHTCLMVRTVYDDIPELRPPIFEFVPGGTMLCVKCRDICPCASCRRRRGEKEQCRRGLGSGLKGFYGLTPEEREEALTRKKEKQEAARIKKESRPPSEKKTPSSSTVVRSREVASIRAAGGGGIYDDDEHGRLEHWAPLPVFPPLPKRRKKKRKRLEIMEGTRLDSQASDTDSDSSCSDSDSNDEETDSDSRSLSSISSFHSGARARVVLGPESFQLPLSSNTRNTVPLLTKGWRSNFSRSLKAASDHSSNFPYHHHTSTTRGGGDKAPVVWIKNGAMVQARKPPTTEFMQRLAQEQKGRSGPDPNFPGDEQPMETSISRPNPNLPLASIDSSHIVGLDQMDISAPTHDFQSSLKLNGNSECTCPMAHLQTLDNLLATHTEKCSIHMNGTRNPSRLTPILEGEAGVVIRGEFGEEMDMERFRSMEGSDPTSLIPLQTNGLEDFEAVGASSPIDDHQTYLASLTDEQLSEILKQGEKEMIKQGLILPSSIDPSNHHHSAGGSMIPKYSTGISPELISAALPSSRSEDQTSSSDLRNQEEGQLNETLTEEDQEARLIEAANWAAVWGATDGAGGFMVTKPTQPDDTLQDNNNHHHNGNHSVHLPNYQPSNHVLPNPSSSSRIFDNSWVHHASGSDKELFLRAMKSRVDDEWLTDVMPLDS
ncbi:hypothetical protein PSTG_15853 [Puccinia striiformis f. sp. tritici PST-78]|uniref:Zinc-finger domain-containing protein n=1 Tax=Puccinia striiformis f. sp. tritici PST-78 TaxID=1165861 RepID=A0A0L0UUT6_9BASI|nr:hypothetical protein PSTG_15853 [Puccinia striiformis f. sp. tritici PST-78]